MGAIRHWLGQAQCLLMLVELVSNKHETANCLDKALAAIMNLLKDASIRNQVCNDRLTRRLLRFGTKHESDRSALPLTPSQTQFTATQFGEIVFSVFASMRWEHSATWQ